MNYILEAFIIGIITIIVGRIVFYLGTCKKQREKKYYKNLNILLFITGVIIHIAFELIGLNKWYCDKKCMTILKEISKKV